MIRRSLDRLLKVVSSHPKAKRLYPLVSGIDHFFYSAAGKTKHAPYIRDSVNLKRWMMLVVLSLMPCTFMAIWNAGLQQFIYESSNASLVEEYVAASESLRGYFSFGFKEGRYLLILKEGLSIFLPILLTSYLVGGIWEVLFACIRGHDIAEGFLVTGILFPLTLPSTIPLWMVALGVSFGVVVSKELFGGTGMNILNPALVCRAFLFFSFPAQMSGEVWIGKKSQEIHESVHKINQERQTADAISQQTWLSALTLGYEIKTIHADAIANYKFGKRGPSIQMIEHQAQEWKKDTNSLQDLSPTEFQQFLSASPSKGGLGLLADNYNGAVRFVDLKEGTGLATLSTLLIGNRPGSLGETSIIACLIGALFLLITQLASWRLMLATALGALFTALAFEWGSRFFLFSPLNPASFDFPAYKHFLIGGLTFGLVFMATDPVSSPAFNSAKWLYGLLIGSLTILIRLINPAFPDGTMLAILFGNVFAPLLDHVALKLHARRYARTN